MHDDGYVWWTERLRRSLDLYDEVRLDHFLGFQSYFSIPAGMTGSAGRWIPGPGLELFERIHEKLGPLPFIAEDLGYLTPAVRALKAQCGFPGMDVLEFSDDDPRFSMPDNPANVVYTSTHDTSTLMGSVSYTHLDVYKRQLYLSYELQAHRMPSPGGPASLWTLSPCLLYTSMSATGLTPPRVSLRQTQP